MFACRQLTPLCSWGWHAAAVTGMTRQHISTAALPDRSYPLSPPMAQMSTSGPVYCPAPTRSSGERYQRVATYSLYRCPGWLPAPASPGTMLRAKPKSLQGRDGRGEGSEECAERRTSRWVQRCVSARVEEVVGVAPAACPLHASALATPTPHHSFRMPAELSRMFSGLMSRWITRLAASEW